MTPSKLAKFLIVSIPFVHSTAGFSAEKPSLPSESSTTIRSLIPFSTDQLDKLTIKPDHKIVSSMPHNNLQKEYTYGGGYGGNEQIGLLVYDGLPNHPSALTIRRDSKNKRCYLENQNAGIYHYNFWGSLKLAYYDCDATSKYHNWVYWNENLDKENGGYSTDNDALYGSIMTNKMFEEWFGIPVKHDSSGAPMPVEIVTHISKLANAYQTEDGSIFLGDGDKSYYPFTSPGIIAFVLAFIFTEQHSNLNPSIDSQSGAIAVAFSAMTDQALKFYIHGENDWQVGGEVSKTGQSLYYIDQPSKDCGSRTPGDGCSIEHISQYKNNMDAHYSSGIYRRAFYLLATAPDWDVKKAFSVMVQANRYYWTSKQDLARGVCGIVKSARELNYNENAVIDAFNQVGLSSELC